VYSPGQILSAVACIREGHANTQTWPKNTAGNNRIAAMLADPTQHQLLFVYQQ